MRQKSRLTAPLLVATGLLALVLAVLVVTAALAQENGPPLLDRDITYTIEFGDTLDQIGAYYDVDVDCIYSANNLTASVILYPGDEIIISPACPPYDGAAVVTNPRLIEAFDASGSPIIYIRSGDTLDTIAQRFNVSLDALLAANELTTTSYIASGDRLIIPTNSPPYGAALPQQPVPVNAESGGGATAYVLQYGDTLDTIAAWFDVQLACLLSINNLTLGSLLLPGQVLVISADCAPYDGTSDRNAAYLHGLALSQAAAQVAIPSAPLPTAIVIEPYVPPTAGAQALPTPLSLGLPSATPTMPLPTPITLDLASPTPSG